MALDDIGVEGRQKMTQARGRNEKLVDKYKPYLTRKGRVAGGIFTPRARGNLLGVPVRGRKPRERDYDFWYDVRSSVATALVDLELFLDTAGDENVKKVLTPESLKPIARSLLLHPVWTNAKPDLSRAEIAEIFIRAGFEYLLQMQKNLVREYDVETTNKALEEAAFLVELFRPPEERRSISALDRPRM
ncbi:MAG: hypothetical protein ACETV1_05085 [Candidatus Bathyarchaeia archaeon]